MIVFRVYVNGELVKEVSFKSRYDVERFVGGSRGGLLFARYGYRHVLKLAAAKLLGEPVISITELKALLGKDFKALKAELSVTRYVEIRIGKRIPMCALPLRAAMEIARKHGVKLRVEGDIVTNGKRFLKPVRLAYPPSYCESTAKTFNARATSL